MPPFSAASTTPRIALSGRESHTPPMKPAPCENCQHPRPIGVISISVLPSRRFFTPCAPFSVEDAGGEMPRGDLAKRGPDLLASRDRVGAAGVEMAAAGRVDRAGDLSFRQVLVVPRLRIRHGDRRQEGLRVGMMG